MGKQQGPGFVIWISGGHRVGKTTVARELVKQLGERNTVVIDYNDLRARPRDPATKRELHYLQVVKEVLLEHVVSEASVTKTVICLGE